MAPRERVLIVNADDFGLSAGVNAGVIDGHEQGIVTSASLMVRPPAATEAGEYGRANPSLSVGLHVDLGEWAYRDGKWVSMYEVVSTDDLSAVEEEVRAQLAGFRDLLGADPTHLDSHQHVHLSEPAVAASLRRLAAELRVPLRSNTPRIRYSGEFYGQGERGEPVPEAITVERLIEILERLPPGTTELGCHPGMGRDLDSMYRDEREAELAALCDARLRETIESEGIELRSFADLARSR